MSFSILAPKFGQTLVQWARTMDSNLGNGPFFRIIWFGVQQSRVSRDKSMIDPGLTWYLSLWSCSLSAAKRVGHLGCMGGSDRTCIIWIVARLVGQITFTGFRHSEMNMCLFKAHNCDRGSKWAKPCSDFLHSALVLRKILRGWENIFKTGPSPDVTGRRANIVLLSRSIGKRVVTANTGSWRSLYKDGKKLDVFKQI